MKILITGGSGLVGTRLSEHLLGEGHEVCHLSRSKGKDRRFHTFQWDPSKMYLEDGALKGVEAIVHLAGAGIADKRWTKSRKKTILDSRVNGSRLLFESLQKEKNPPSTFIAASAVGYYGDRADEILTEDSGSQPVFLSQVCAAWEEEVKQIETLGIRTVRLRIGIVLDKEGGALPKMALSLNFGVCPLFGDGKQYYPWIHYQDLTRMFVHSIEQQSIRGVYNAVGPNPCTNRELMETLKGVLSKFALIVSGPIPLFRVTLGEMLDMVLYSARVSAHKIEQSGFRFDYPVLENALKNIYHSGN